MSCNAVRAIAAIFAVAVTGIGLSGIAALADTVSSVPPYVVADSQRCR